MSDKNTDNDWIDLVNRIRKDFRISATGADRGIKNAEADSKLLGLRVGQSKVQCSTDSSKFRPQDVEPLLDQACIILDRANTDLMAAQTLGEKFANLKFELDQFLSLDEILVREEADGKFKVQAAVSKSQYESNEARRKGLKTVVDARSELLNLLDPNTGPGFIAAWRAGGIAYVRAQYAGSDAGQGVFWPVPDGTAGGAPVRGGNKVDVDLSLTHDQYAYEHQNEMKSVQAAQAAAQFELTSADHAAEGLTAQANWDNKNTEYLQDRAERIRQLMRYRAALTKHGDLLDFQSRITPLKDRYQQQLADAYARLSAVDIGLTKIYDYAPLGVPDPLPELGDDVQDFEHILAWTRRVAAWLAAFTRRCHNYVLPLSVKNLAGAGWASGVKKGEWKFTIDKGMFADNERHVRVRGICAWCVPQGGPYTLDVEIPAETSIRYESGTWKENVRQSVKSCRLGRVLPRSSFPVPEVGGVTALYNASPFGEWKVRASDPFSSHSKDWPSDFQIDLYLSVLPV